MTRPMGLGEQGAAAGVIAGLVLWWWNAAPLLWSGEWPPMTELDAGLHGAALWWTGRQLLVRWRQPTEGDQDDGR